jgi:tRNA pseudouridine55 synthase
MDRVLVLDKAAGLSSQQAVTEVKRALRARKAGHAGTLDPMATGVLLVCLGEATKISRLLMDLRKEYRATLRFGERTDTFDAEGEVVEKVEGVVPAIEEINKALGSFRGRIMQRPPMYSALKRNGTPLYKLARKGLEVERQEREVTVYSIEAVHYGFPFLELLLSCSKGTYVRSLADDLGRTLGTVAHLSGLRRTAVGTFRADDAVSLEALREGAGSLLSIDEALEHVPDVTLKEADFKRARHGGAVSASGYRLMEGVAVIRLRDPEGRTFALGRAVDGALKVERVLHVREESLNQ